MEWRQTTFLDEPECLDTAPEPQTEYSQEFEEFWGACPRKVAKKKAWESWCKAVQETSASLIVDAMRRFASSEEVASREVKFVPHPTTWLNQRRFEDELEPEPEDEEVCAYIQTDPINRPRHRENIPISRLETTRANVRRQIFEHLRVCDKPFCEACNSRNVQAYRTLFLERYGAARCDFGPPPGERDEETILRMKATQRQWEDLRRRNPGMRNVRLYSYDREEI